MSEKILISLMCIMTSTTITFKLLSELGLEKEKEKLFVFSVSVLEDFTSVFLLSFISGLNFVSLELSIFSFVKSLF